MRKHAQVMLVFVDLFLRVGCYTYSDRQVGVQGRPTISVKQLSIVKRGNITCRLFRGKRLIYSVLN